MQNRFMPRWAKILTLLLLIIGIGILLLQAFTRVAPGIAPPPADITTLIDSENTPLQIPKGFSIEIFAKQLPGARVMAFDTFGNMWVSQPSEGTVSLVEIDHETNTVRHAYPILKNLKKPHGLLFGAGDESTALYIAEEHQIIKIATYSDQEKPDVVIALPTDGGHYTRTITWLPGFENKKMLVSIGSSCNVCVEKDARRATIMLLDTETKVLTPYATGLRNAVFMATHPVTGDIWATEMGRDNLGDNLPPDEINIISNGGNYGWPICYGKNIHDTDFDKNTYIRNPCMEPFETASHIDIPAHSAPLGIAFFPEEGWPEKYWYTALVALHGSWNRSEPTGYKIVRHILDAQGMPIREPEDFITGWLTPDGALGRPVDIYIRPGGVIFISDDKAGVIYKLIHHTL